MTAILRLVADQHGRLVHGELVDLQGRRCGRFAEWAALLQLVQRWLQRPL